MRIVEGSAISDVHIIGSAKVKDCNGHNPFQDVMGAIMDPVHYACKCKALNVKFAQQWIGTWS